MSAWVPWCRGAGYKLSQERGGQHLPLRASQWGRHLARFMEHDSDLPYPFIRKVWPRHKQGYSESGPGTEGGSHGLDGDCGKAILSHVPTGSFLCK